MIPIQEEEGVLARPGGKETFYRVWKSPSPRATVAVVHGFGEHSGRYAEVGRAFAERGYRVAALDLTGFGRASGARGHVDRWDDYLDDVASFLDGPATGPVRPLFLLAHSMGGLVAFDFLERRGAQGVAAIVATSPLLGVAVKVGWAKALLGRIASRVAPRFSLPTGIRGTDVTHDPAKQAEFDADPLIVKKASARWYTEMLAAIERVHASAGKVAIPTLIVHAGADRVTDAAGSRRLVEKVSHQCREFRTRPGEFHEVLNEVRRQELYGEILDWLDSINASSPIGSSP